MAKYSTTVKLDKRQDAWSWYDVSRDPIFASFHWRDNLNGEMQSKFDQITSLKNQAADPPRGYWLRRTFCFSQKIAYRMAKDPRF